MNSTEVGNCTYMNCLGFIKVFILVIFQYFIELFFKYMGIEHSCKQSNFKLQNTSLNLLLTQYAVQEDCVMSCFFLILNRRL